MNSSPSGAVAAPCKQRCAGNAFNIERLERRLAAETRRFRATTHLEGWFLTQEIRMEALAELERLGSAAAPVVREALLLEAVCRRLPLTIHPSQVFAGTQEDGFSRSYELINPEFAVERFAGYCDPMAVYQAIAPDPQRGLNSARIAGVRDFWSQREFASELAKVYEKTGDETREVVYFVEQVTGHTVADFRATLAGGLTPMIAQAKQRCAAAKDPARTAFYQAAVISLNAVLHLADRYAELARSAADETSDSVRRDELMRIAQTCPRVLREGATDLYEAIQAFVLLWMAMVLEQSPNPYAFSVGNLDRILQPYYARGGIAREAAVLLVGHLLAFFNVGDRSWAISQNIMVGGRDVAGHDLTNDMTGVILDAFARCNYPQPALSVKLHARTPASLYAAMEPFFSRPGSVTPSLFNDDLLFDVLRRKGIREEDLADYSIAGCQEPLVMGQESGNTTNSWLNLAKVLELTLHDGHSAITGKRLGLSWRELGLDETNPLADASALQAAFWKQLDHFLPRMAEAANGCTRALAKLPTPLLSCFLGGMDHGGDLRDIDRQNTRYNASGCLIHGLSVVADSFMAIGTLGRTAPQTLKDLPAALRADFEKFESLRARCVGAPKYGNDQAAVDELAAQIAQGVCERVSALRNPWGRPFLPDWSTPSTHVLYGYWVGATPDGRKARTMLGYGVDPTAGMATHGLPPRILSLHRLPVDAFTGGYASHVGLDRNMINGIGSKGAVAAIHDFVLKPLFGFTPADAGRGYYVYFNVDTAAHLRALLKNPNELAPSGVYIMRIHGTFVNFLDLSPAIQEDIIARLDPASTSVVV